MEVPSYSVIMAEDNNFMKIVYILYWCALKRNFITYG